MTLATLQHLFYRNIPLLLLGILICSGCAPIVNVQSQFDSTVNFRTYRTFAWHPAEIPTRREVGSGPQFSTLIDLRVREAVASELVKAGLNPINDELPDLLVAYDIAVDIQQETADAGTAQAGYGYGYSYWYGYRYRYGYAGVSALSNTPNYPPGTLIIDLVDPDTNQLVWRGWLEAEIDPSYIEPEKINRAVASIMAQFPPVSDITR